MKLQIMSEQETTKRSGAVVKLRQGILMVPCERSSVAYADEVRRALFAYQPHRVALEFPGALSHELVGLIEELPRINVLAWKSPSGRALYLPADPCDAIIQAARSAMNMGLPVACVDGLEGEPRGDELELPDDYSVSELGLSAHYEAICRLTQMPEATARDRELHARLVSASPQDEETILVGSIRTCRVLQAIETEGGPFPSVEPFTADGSHAEILPLSEDQVGLAIREIPMLVAQYERQWELLDFEGPFPVFQAIEQILDRCSRHYEETYESSISVTQRRTLLQFMRNLAFVRGGLRPRMHELIMAAKACVDGDFAALCFDIANTYPPNVDLDAREDERKDELRHRSLDLHADLGSGMERLECAFPTHELTEVEYTFKRRKRFSEWDRRRWQREFGRDAFLLGNGICSWPPEDEFIERFFNKVRRKAKEELIEKGSSVEEFSTSLLDGLDLRETVRNVHQETIYVRRERVRRGEVGPVVVIWEQDALVHDPGLWQTTLYAENQNESDIAFYSTMPGDEMTGPGISRLEYGGILSIYPASGIPDIWSFRPRLPVSNAAELLIAWGILLSEERFVAVVSDKKPSSDLRQLARTHDRELLHLPLRAFPRAMMKKARRAHLLSGRHVRNYAADYIEEL